MNRLICIWVTILLLFWSLPGITSEPSVKPSVKSSVKIDIKEWQVPWADTRPRDPALDSRGKVWFCGQSGNYIASLDPNSGKFRKYSLPDGTYPHNLIIDTQDFIWYAGNRNSHIGRINPANGDIERIDMPAKNPIDPHTLVFDSIGNIWFTAQWGNKIGFLDVESRQVKLLDSPLPQSRPYGIKIDGDNNPWIVLFGTNQLARVDAITLQFSLHALPHQQQRPRRLEIDDKNQIWLLDHELGYVSRYRKDTQAFKQWQVAEKHQANLYGSAMDNEQRLWVAVTGTSPNQLRIFDTRQETFIGAADIPSGAGTIRYMFYHQPDNSVWFGTDANTIGRAMIKPITDSP
ncbi:Vgb family protein [Thalassotalea mangrovi]|uniref:Lyase n=1 Tax=Thalassotalea mangrovi TaxID=2572245 RepID=A0A4U1B244_9GAMM|nr:lyase [Thalassotalea mangrovi]TKB43425.1 lyase [Thalassotalea mangrovi]